GHDPNERLAMVGFAVDPPEILRRDGILQEGVTCREDSPDRLDGVTGEGDLHPSLLLDLGRVSMPRGCVDPHDPGAFRMLRCRPPSTPPADDPVFASTTSRSGSMRPAFASGWIARIAAVAMQPGPETNVAWRIASR